MEQRTNVIYCPLLRQNINIIYEDNHLIAADKPCGVLSQGDYSGAATLPDSIRHYLKTKYGKPGNVFLGVIHRLDREVSGLIVFAKTSKAAARLSEQIRDRRFVKTLIKHQGYSVISAHPEAKEARLSFRIIGRQAKFCGVEINLHTGRHHQIRVQFASRGNPIAGDRLYGSLSAPEIFGKQGIALHAYSLRFTHPISKEILSIHTPLPVFLKLDLPA
ncbi:hypothetical protein CHS0354_035299 [Potamilus streckersoni]|uniref:Pseudouridine synthase RsuA/RluA-like domain-containing protein n=1 Tax=Potamilus streckersoni TaxID=2493646 RepID=A0AAE0VMZ4_9BIVA|nr:hypothetical protein CHS0354_035299 [Potamilus streckersoni]